MSEQILKKAAIEALAGLDKTHFLNARAVRHNKSLGDHCGLKNLGVHLISVEPGFYSTERHRHFDEEECIYILSGRAKAIIGEQTSEVEAGDFIAYPTAGEAHCLYNHGDETLICLVIGQRLAHDTTDYPDKGKRLYRRADAPADLVDIAAIDHPTVGKKS